MTEILEPIEKSAFDLWYIFANFPHYGRPLYHGFPRELKNKRWFPITKEQYDETLSIIKSKGSNIPGCSLVPTISSGVTHGNCYLFEEGIVALYNEDSGLGERQYQIKVITENNREDRGISLARKLKLPLPE